MGRSKRKPSSASASASTKNADAANQPVHRTRRGRVGDLGRLPSDRTRTRTRKGIDMFDHERLDVYRVGLEFVAWAYGHRRSLEGADRHAPDPLLRASQWIPLNMHHLTGEACGVPVLAAPPGLAAFLLPGNPWLAPWQGFWRRSAAWFAAPPGRGWSRIRTQSMESGPDG